MLCAASTAFGCNYDTDSAERKGPQKPVMDELTQLDRAAAKLGATAFHAQSALDVVGHRYVVMRALVHGYKQRRDARADAVRSLDKSRALLGIKLEKLGRDAQPTIGTLYHTELKLNEHLSRARTDSRKLLSAKSGVVRQALLNACVDWSVAVRRRLPALHTEVPRLYSAPQCGGDITRDRLLPRYCRAVVNENYAEAAAALGAISSQLRCVSSRQLGAFENAMVSELDDAIAAHSPDKSFADQRSYLARSMRQVAAGPLFLVADATRRFRKFDKPALNWFKQHRGELTKAAGQPGTILYGAGLPIADPLTGNMVMATPRCMPAAKRSQVFRGSQKERFLKFRSVDGESCNALPSMVDAVGLPCASRDWAPAGNRSDLADGFICPPDCLEGQSAGAATQAGFDLGHGLAGWQTQAGSDPAIDTGCVGAGSSGGGDDGDVAGGRMGGLAVGGDRDCMMSMLNGHASNPIQEQAACIIGNTDTTPLAGSLSSIGYTPTGGAGCFNAAADGEDNLPPATDNNTVQDAREQAAEDGYTYGGWIDEDASSWEVWEDGEGGYMLIDTETGEGFVTDIDGLDAWIDEVAPDDVPDTEAPQDPDATDGDGRKNFFTTIYTSGGDSYVQSVKWYGRRPPTAAEAAQLCWNCEIDAYAVNEDWVDGVWGGRTNNGFRGRDCGPDVPDCSSCTGQDQQYQTIMECLFDNVDFVDAPWAPSEDDPHDPSAPIDPIPDGPGSNYGAGGFDLNQTCFGGGTPDVVCPEQTVTMCPPEQPNCACGPPAGAPIPATSTICTEIQCADSLATGEAMTGTQVGANCGCTGVAGGEGGGSVPMDTSVDGSLSSFGECTASEPFCAGDNGAW